MFDSDTRPFETVSAYRGIHNSLLCIIRIQRVTAYEFRVGAYNSSAFEHSIVTKMGPYFRERSEILTLENVRFVKTPGFISTLRGSNIHHKFPVQYFPAFNQFGDFLSMLKAQNRSISND